MDVMAIDAKGANREGMEKSVAEMTGIFGSASVMVALPVALCL